MCACPRIPIRGSTGEAWPNWRHVSATFRRLVSAFFAKSPTGVPDTRVVFRVVGWKDAGCFGVSAVAPPFFNSASSQVTVGAVFLLLLPVACCLLPMGERRLIFQPISRTKLTLVD